MTYGIGCVWGMPTLSPLSSLDLELFRNVSVHEIYRLKALITLEQVNNTEWSKKKKNLN